MIQNNKMNYLLIMNFSTLPIILMMILNKKNRMIKKANLI